MNTQTFAQDQDFTAIKEAGFSVSADDLAKTQFELLDEELEGVAGGGGGRFGRIEGDIGGVIDAGRTRRNTY